MPEGRQTGEPEGLEQSGVGGTQPNKRQIFMLGFAIAEPNLR
ncbi:hypothetical protein NIES4071_98830 [Calothrix sp. NIES-4071]|nr:hypothetical protein NIES4071_98830 [Calothrix sp. NIES-4071]BAZ64147.1 hypothetical protein NIES4105_98760 [Calothrix sp. NIES-4105]